jgi:hypothetical protein
MKAIIKVVTARKEFTPDQKQILRRVNNVLMEHNLSVSITFSEKVKRNKLFEVKKNQKIA